MVINKVAVEKCARIKRGIDGGYSKGGVESSGESRNSLCGRPGYSRDRFIHGHQQIMDRKMTFSLR